MSHLSYLISQSMSDVQELQLNGLGRSIIPTEKQDEE